MDLADQTICQIMTLIYQPIYQHSLKKEKLHEAENNPINPRMHELDGKRRVRWKFHRTGREGTRLIG
jgi:hypothetical protein